MKLAQRAAIVTGAGSGIGRAIALAYAREGARVAAVDINGPAAAETVREMRRPPDAVLTLDADIAEPAQVRAMVEEVVGRFGGVDVLCHSAGLDQPIRPIADLDLETWDRVMAVNARGAFLCAQAVLPAMLRAGRGSIIMVASDLGYLAVPGLGAYCMSKGAVLQLTRVLAAEYGRHHIRANAICPTMVDTPMARRAVASHPDPDAWMREIAQSIPIGRIGRPEEIAEAAVFLASDDSSFMTGSLVAVDGGRSAV